MIISWLQNYTTVKFVALNNVNRWFIRYDQIYFFYTRYLENNQINNENKQYEQCWGIISVYIEISDYLII